MHWFIYSNFLLAFSSLVLCVRVYDDESVIQREMQSCFDCICQARRDCKISRRFWEVSGKLSPPDSEPDEAYESCMRHEACPRKTLENFFSEFQKDCDKDGSIDCYDYARMHTFGPYECGESPTQNLKEVNHCLGLLLNQHIKIQRNISDECYKCICGDESCSLSRLFWEDAGGLYPPDTDEKYAYENCMNSPLCVRKTMEKYFTKYQQDCNDDGVVDCKDYARIHMFGPFGCRVRSQGLEQIISCIG